MWYKIREKVNIILMNISQELRSGRAETTLSAQCAPKNHALVFIQRFQGDDAAGRIVYQNIVTITAIILKEMDLGRRLDAAIHLNLYERDRPIVEDHRVVLPNDKIIEGSHARTICRDHSRQNQKEKQTEHDQKISLHFTPPLNWLKVHILVS